MYSDLNISNPNFLSSNIANLFRKKDLSLPPTIACIDDSKTVQFFVQSILCPFGYQVLSITQPRQQLLELFNHQPHLILMDINLRDLNGYQLCQILHNSPITKHIPIVMFTSETGIVPRIRAKFHSAISYLNKSCSPQDLIDTIEMAIAKFSRS